MFQLLAQTEELFLTNGVSIQGIRQREIAKNSDLIDFCTTTYSSVRNREYCISVRFAQPEWTSGQMPKPQPQTLQLQAASAPQQGWVQAVHCLVQPDFNAQQ